MYKELFDTGLLRNISGFFTTHQQTIAVGESVTSGLLQFAFSNMPDAQHFFQGGLTAYNVAQKFKHLNVEPVHALGCNCVSQKVADEMACHAATIFNAHWGIGITGYATPAEASGGQVFAYFSIAYKGNIRDSGKMDQPGTEPPAAQLGYVNHVLARLHDACSAVGRYPEPC